MLERATLKFKHQALRDLHQSLFIDPKQEAYAVLLGKTEIVDSEAIIKVMRISYPQPNEYILQNSYQIKVHRSFLEACLNEIDRQPYLDTIIEVHTHPFAKEKPTFSSLDNEHERNLKTFLLETEPSIHYGSLLFSPTNYRGRLYVDHDENQFTAIPLSIKTQTKYEHYDLFPLQRRKFLNNHHLFPLPEVLDSCITLISTGLALPLMASLLQNIGMKHLNLIELSQKKISIYTPEAQGAKAYSLSDPLVELEKIIARSDYVVLYSNDEIFNRRVQAIAFTYFVPFIVGTTYVHYVDLALTAWMGQIITAHMGDQVCYQCGQVNAYSRHESHSFIKNNHKRRRILPNPYERPQLPVDMMVAGLCLDQLILELQGKQTESLIVFENEGIPSVYPRTDFLKERDVPCIHCLL